MKVVLILVIVIAVLLGIYYVSGSSSEETFDPTQQGKDARAKASQCADWLEVLERIGEPRNWRDGPSELDFTYLDPFTAETRDEIARRLEARELQAGFSFLYRYSEEATFAVNFNNQGKFTAIEDKLSKSELLGEED
jgi:hypothetical protein